MASWWMPRKQYAQLAAFYQFARGADDIADDPGLGEAQKHQLLTELCSLTVNPGAQHMPEWLLPYHHLVHEQGFPAEPGQQLLAAFLQDVHKQRYDDWQELLDYCSKSAAPVGRAVLHMYGEDRANVAASDALCSALQIINHLQDIGEDYTKRDRVYFPASWFGGLQRLSAQTASPAVRAGLNEAITRAQLLVDKGADLPTSIRHRLLRYQVRYIIKICRMLLEKLRLEDPLAQKVRLSRMEKMRAVFACMQQRY